MFLTNAQFDLLSKSENGIVWKWHKSPDDDEIMRFLMDKKLVSSREDIGPDVLKTTQAGKALLEKLSEKRAQEDLDTIKERHSENKRIQERREDKADEKRSKQQDRLHDLFMVLLGAALGVLAEYLLKKLFGT